MIDTVRTCRTAATALSGQANIGGPEYEAATALMRRIDDMAGVLTGNREMFWEQAPSTLRAPFVSADGQAEASELGPLSSTSGVAEDRPVP
ncbi:MAG: hypothetical protein INR70_25145 [Parafilimonas terrae]|nr:hypothetical protein [Parafilimonas terrae]